MPIQYPNGWLEAMNRSGKLYSPADAYRLVPMLYRAVNLRADALSSVPFQLTRNNQQVSVMAIILARMGSLRGSTAASKS